MSNVSDKWKTISSKKVLTTPRISVTEDTVQQPNGENTVYYVVQKEPFSVVVPYLENRNLVLVRQYRYPISSISLEFPMGTTQGNNPLETARQELLQETGYRSTELINLGEFWPSVGTSAQKEYIFLAKGLTKGEQELEDGEFIDVEEYSLDEVSDKIKNREIQDVHSITAFYLLREYLKQNE